MFLTNLKNKYYPHLKKTIVIVLFILGFFPLLLAQDFNDRFISGDPSSSQTSELDSTQRNSFFDIFTGRPGKAAFYSLIIPGGGQFYNRRYWKVPLVVGGEAAAFWWLFDNSDKFNHWQEGYRGLLSGSIDIFEGVTDPNRAKIIRDGYRKRKEYAYIIVIVAHLFNVFEAFIDRHLIDFDTSDDLSYFPRILPSDSSQHPIGITLSWNISKKKPKLNLKNFFGTMSD
jgi:hypothetical protein